MISSKEILTSEIFSTMEEKQDYSKKAGKNLGIITSDILSSEEINKVKEHISKSKIKGNRITRFSLFFCIKSLYDHKSVNNNDIPVFKM